MDLGRASEALSAAHAALEIANELESQRLQANALQLISTVPCLPWWILVDFSTLWWTNIAMENHNFSWENPL